MHIAIDIRSLMESKRSGVAEYTQNLIEKLLKIDLQNQYFLFYNSLSDVRDNLPKWNQANVHLCGFRYPNKLFNLALKLLNYPKLDQLILKNSKPNLSGIEGLKIKNFRIDLLFIPNLNFIAVSPNCKKITTVHDLSFERYPAFYSLKRRLWHKIINPKKLISSSDQIIAVSENTKKDLIDLYKIPVEKIKVIYSGISEEFKPTTNQEKINQIRKKYDLPDNFIYYLGNLEPRKNIEGLIQAFEILKSSNKLSPASYRLIIAGSPSWSFKSIYKFLKKNKFKNEIKLIGYVEPKDKPYLYNLAKLFVYPSFYEGFGFPPLEAMASGTPVIASLAPSLGEIIGPGGLLVDPYNTNEIAEAMIQILNNKKLKNSLIEKGLKQAKKFSWEQCALETLNLFKQICA
jgi:glycosyltransferase involved in cell wall biosynthesis